MSKLSELISELCPDGVEFIPVNDLVLLNQYKQIGADELEKMIVPNGNIRLLPSSKNFDWYTTKEIAGNFLNYGEVFVMGRARYANTKYVNGFFVSSNNIIIESNNTEKVLTKFLYHYLNSKTSEFYVETGTYPKFDTSLFKKLLVPIPPIEIQTEIVRILDSFSDKSNELISLLKRELILRKKQYQYYRDQLLTFDSDVEFVNLGDVCDISSGGDAPKDSMSLYKYQQYQIPVISNGTGQNAFYGYTNIAKINKPAVTIAARGTIGYAEYRDYPYFPIIRLLNVIPKDNTFLDTKFLYYCLQDKEYKLPVSGIPQLTVPMLKEIKIPVPSIEKQKKIVSILDRFDSLCNDLTSGIPAEINARKKQYEFYRDKLLSFKQII